MKTTAETYYGPWLPAIPTPFAGRVGLRIEVLTAGDERVAGPCWDWQMQEHLGRLSNALLIDTPEPGIRYRLRDGRIATRRTVAANGELIIGVRGRGQILPVCS